MNTFRPVLLGLAMISAVAISIGMAWQDPEKLVQDRSLFMKAKVQHSKEIVEALAMENYDSIADHAQDLMLLMNDSIWNAIQTPEYVAMSGEFRSAAEHLRDAAHDKNIDSATLAFFEVTLNCVRCHKYVRKWGNNKSPNKR